MADAIKVVGWSKARPVIEGALGTVPVKGSHGAWWGQVGKRAGARILAGLAAIPVEPHQERLPLKRVRSITSPAFVTIASPERQTLTSTMEGS